ncbi:MAG: dTMP kinase [Steroidobacteraceae bacterium]|nr:dTMP kinase [Steroidobacteraceae bacterium]MDW8260203.1 dTMP kinase [Gammaproteobacteria bacterium]
MRQGKRGLFVTIEGIEGAGKTTLASALERRLVDRGLAVVVTREPGGTPLAEKLRDAVLARGNESISPVAETLLMFAARAVHLDNRIRPALARGSVVICDRFTDATRAYQGAGRAVASELIERLAAAVHGDLQPDITFLLDLPVAEGLARSRRRGSDTDRFEEESIAFFERVRSRYRALAEQEPQRFVILSATADPDQLAQSAWAALQARL